MVDMVINAKTVRALRKHKLWSQEELAIACGIGLRTIQRLESTGQGSPATIKALAAVFEIDSALLLELDTAPPSYLNIQLGYPVIGITIIISVVLCYLFNIESLGVTEFSIVMCLLCMIAIVFTTLTTQVANGEVKWHLGLGIIRKTVDVSTITSHRTVRNKAWWGVGVRLIPDGYLYNVSGLGAVELRLSNGKIVRIGSDEPEAFNQAISDAKTQFLNHNPSG